MAEYVKHTGGSVAGKSKKPYDAMVYKDADSGYTIAVDGNGNVIKKVLSASNTDDVAIQAAIDLLTSGGVVNISSETYNISTRIDIEEKVKISFENSSIIKPSSDVDIFYIKNGSCIDGCEIDVTDIVGYSKSCIVVDGKESFEAYNNTRIENIIFKNDELSGTAIRFQAIDATAGHIVGVCVANCRILRFQYGISIVATDPGASSNWINSNIFSNIYGYSTTNFIYMSVTTPYTGHSQIQSNTFVNVVFQSSATTQPNPCITMYGHYNNFINLKIWDWLTGGGWNAYYITFGATVACGYNYIVIQSANQKSYINDLGSNNTVFFSDTGSTYKTPNWSNGYCKVVNTDLLYTTLYGALSTITDASSSKQYTIEVHGNITETALITAKSYVDVVGFGANININTNTNGAGVAFNNLVYTTWKDLTIRRNGTVTTESYVIDILGTTDDTVVLNNITAKNEITAAVSLCHGAHVRGSSCPKLYNCKFVGSVGGSGSSGITISGSAYPSLFGCNTTGGNAANCKGLYITGTTLPFIMSCISIGGSTSDYGLYMNSTAAAIILNCRFYSPTAAAAGYISTTARTAGLFRIENCSFKSVSGNDLEGESSGLVPVYNCVFGKISNIIIPGQGTAATITAGNTYVDVTHGLASTPTRVRITPTTNLGTRSFWVDTKGAATFRININSSDVIDHTFDWEAEV